MGGRKPRRGRPSLGDQAHTQVLSLKVSAAERAEWERRAAKAGLSMSEWIRSRCNAD